MKLEKIVYEALDKRTIPELGKGYYFNGDRDWKDIANFVKRPDVIFFEECGDREVSVRPYDVKSTLNGNVKLAQISPLTLVNLYKNDEFRDCLYDNLNLRGFRNYNITFEEGEFIAPKAACKNLPYDCDGLVNKFEDASDKLFEKKKKKIDLLRDIFGFFPFNVFLRDGKRKRRINVISDYGSFDTDAYRVNLDVRSSVTYIKNVTEKKIEWRKRKFPAIVF